MNAQVTIGLPFVNDIRTVTMAVRSVMAQSFSDWKLILMDDGSSDGSRELLRQITDPRVTVVSDGANLGLAHRLNQLAALADTPLLARMDADDMMHPNRLELQVASLDNDAESALVFSSAISVDADDRPTGYRASLDKASVARHFRHSPYIHPTLVGRTEWFRNNLYDPEFRRCQDQELWVRTFGRQRIVTLEQPLLYLREAGTVPATKYAASMNGTRQVLRLHGARHLGLVKTQSRIAQTYFKQAAFNAAEHLGQSTRLVDARAEPLSPELLTHHAGILGLIRATRIPGITA